MAIITTWIGFQVGIISDALLNIEGFDLSAYGLFLNSIPYSFYPFLAIVLVGLIVGTGKDFGPMLKAEQKAIDSDKTTLENLTSSKKINAHSQENDLFVKENISYKARNAVIPIGVLVFSMFYFVFTSGQGSTIERNTR